MRSSKMGTASTVRRVADTALHSVWIPHEITIVFTRAISWSIRSRLSHISWLEGPHPTAKPTLRSLWRCLCLMRVSIMGGKWGCCGSKLKVKDWRKLRRFNCLIRPCEWIKFFDRYNFYIISIFLATLSLVMNILSWPLAVILDRLKRQRSFTPTNRVWWTHCRGDSSSLEYTWNMPSLNPWSTIQSKMRSLVG